MRVGGGAATSRSIAVLRRWGRGERGAAMIEFALTEPFVLLVRMGAFDYCWQMYAQRVVQGAVSEAGRDSTLEAYASNQSALDTIVREQVQQVFAHAEVKFTRKAYDRFDQVGVEERYTDANKNGSYDTGEG